MNTHQMKTFLLLTGSLAIYLMAGTGCKDEQELVDPCFGINCTNGQCADGACRCDYGFTGTDCSEELIPKWIGVDTVVLTGILNACNDWDQEDGLLVNDADVYIRILCQGQELYNTKGRAIENTSCAHGCLYPTLLIIKQLTMPHTLEIYDADEGDVDQLIGSVEFTPWQALQGWKFPNRTLAFHRPQSCTIGLNSNYIPVSLVFEGIFYVF